MIPDLRAVIAKALGVSQSKVREETKAEDLKEWDSLGHILVVLAVEKVYGVHFMAEQMAEMTSVAAILNGVERMMH